MKKLDFFVLFVLVAAGLFLITGIPQVSKSADVCDGINLTTHVPIPPYTVVSKKPVKGHNLCEMILKIKTRGMNGYTYVPVYAAKDFVIAGEMFKNRHQISQEEINKLKSQEFSKTFKQYQPQLEKLTAAVYQPDKAGKRYLYFITDPLCSYCNTAKKQIRDLAEKYDFSVKTVFFPVHGKSSRSKISSFICGHKTYNDYLNNNFGNKTACEAGDKYLSRSVELGVKLGVNGTPTFITDNGDLVPGLDTRKVAKLMSGQN